MKFRNYINQIVCAWSGVLSCFLLERDGDGFGVVDGDMEWGRECCLLWSVGEM